MKSRVLAAVIAAGLFCLCAQANAFEFLRMMGGGYCGCGCDNACGADKGCGCAAPTCAAPTCAAPAPTCAAAPSCGCDNTCGCDNGCGRCHKQRCCKQRCCKERCGHHRNRCCN